MSIYGTLERERERERERESRTSSLFSWYISLLFGVEIQIILKEIQKLLLFCLYVCTVLFCSAERVPASDCLLKNRDIA